MTCLLSKFSCIFVSFTYMFQDNLSTSSLEIHCMHPDNNATNTKMFLDTLPNTTNCSSGMDVILHSDIEVEISPQRLFFTVLTPLVILIGLAGNILSLVVYMSRNMRKLSASVYLAALSASDTIVLFFYVLPEWLKHGTLTLIDPNNVLFLQKEGFCQLIVYVQYMSRFLSSWFVVFFTIERCIGVCFPLRRKEICNPKTAHQIVLVTILLSSFLCLFKPILSEVSYNTINKTPLCTSTNSMQHVSFILDSIFGIIISFVPFVLITFLNVLIIRKLFISRAQTRKFRVVTHESKIRLEFTFILLGISICFVALNLPYYVVWCERYWTTRLKSHTTTYSALKEQHNSIQELDNILHVTRAIFYVNYSINFFLYAVTGAYFRKELRFVFKRDRRRKSVRFRRSFPRSNSARTTPNTWV